MRARLTWLGLVLAACAEGGGGPSDANVEPLDAGAPDSGRLLAGPLIPPERYDCRLGAALPARPANALPLSCAFDSACRERLVVAHRSGGGTAPGLGVLAPENTMSALRAAIAMGVDFVETDPRATEDGVIVNVHDPDISKTTTATGAVSDLTWDELRALDLAFPDTVQGDFSCDRVITIRELLVAAKGRVNVLLDANKIGLQHVGALVALVRETDTFAEAVFDTSSLEKIARARALEPAIKVHIRPDAPDEIGAQLDRVGSPAPVIVELDVPDLDEGAPLVRARSPGTRVMSDSLGPLDLQSAIEGAASADQLRLYDRGADLVQTDRPDLLLKALGRL